jgi:uncharacterized protein with HEPN domain
MDIIRIHGYIPDIITAIEAIQNFIEGHTIRSIGTDDKTLSAIIRKFEVMGEAAITNTSSKSMPYYPRIAENQIGAGEKLIENFHRQQLLIEA